MRGDQKTTRRERTRPPRPSAETVTAQDVEDDVKYGHNDLGGFSELRRDKGIGSEGE